MELDATACYRAPARPRIAGGRGRVAGAQRCEEKMVMNGVQTSVAARRETPGGRGGVTALRVVRRSSPIGEMLVAWDEADRLHVLDFADCEARTRRLLAVRYGAIELVDAAVPAAISRALDAYFAGHPAALDALPVASVGTPFQRQVWAALRRIPAGTTTSYGQLAAGLGRQGASRAVGTANGANLIALVVPCHRVIGANGAATGYAGGIDRKRWLLAHEGVTGWKEEAA
jgi:O-6-methylguanine DNA methyltransferase